MAVMPENHTLLLTNNFQVVHMFFHYELDPSSLYTVCSNGLESSTRTDIRTRFAQLISGTIIAFWTSSSPPCVPQPWNGHRLRERPLNCTDISFFRAVAPVGSNANESPGEKAGLFSLRYDDVVSK